MTRAIVALPLAGFLIVVSQVDRSIPSTFVAAAQRSPVEFVQALAGASVPGGIEIRQSDDSSPNILPSTIPGSESRVAVSEVINAFGRHHSKYRLALMSGVLVVRPADQARSFLDEQVKAPHAPEKITGVMAAARRVFSQLDPRLSSAALNSLGRPGEDIAILLDPSGGARVIDLLNEIAAQAPSQAWIVTTRKEGESVKIVSFGFVAGDGGRRTQKLPRD